uniref:Uncharacterized protein n=1 Tax=viral metagenome TaxID=1070528 RepID=A0A6C0ERN3_9ZZZZ
MPARKQLILEHDDGTLEYLPIPQSKKKVITEDLGKIFEMGICLLYNIPYDGKYKYSMEQAEKIKTKIYDLKDIFPYTITHTAKSGSQYDFTCKDLTDMYLSAKTTKKDGKVCPQVIGQPSKKKFCQYFNLDISINIDQIKEYIITNISNMLEIYFNYTFDCPIIYYNEAKELLLFIKKTANIDWLSLNIEFSHIKKCKSWGESSTINIEGVSIGEFQIHNHRDCIKFRWCFEKLLDTFSQHFTIIKF